MSWPVVIMIAGLIVIAVLLLCRWWLFRDIDKMQKELDALEYEWLEELERHHKKRKP